MAKKANRRRGEVELEGGDGKSYILKFGTNAIAKLEEEFSQPLGQMMDELSGDKLSMKKIRTMVKLSIVGEELTDEQVGDLIDDVGLKTITKAFGGVFDDFAEKDEKAGKKEGAQNPPESASASGASAS